MIGARGIKLWALFLLIAVGRAARPEVRRLNLNGRQLESLFHWLYDLAKSAPFDVTPREGYHYRRVLLQRRAAELAIPVAHLLAEANGRSRRRQMLRRRQGDQDRARAARRQRRQGVLFISHQAMSSPAAF